MKKEKIKIKVNKKMKKIYNLNFK